MNRRGLQVIKPVVVTPAMMLSTNVPEDDYPAWDEEESYAIGERVLIATTEQEQGAVFESVQDENLGNPPADTPDSWLRVGPTNRWRAFDDSFSTQTAQADSIVYEIKPGQAVNAVAALNMSGQGALKITMINNDGSVVYERTLPVVAVQQTSDWWSWFFSARSVPDIHIADDLPAYPLATVRLELFGGEELAIGILLLGVQSSFGLGVRLGASIELVDYSRKDTNEYGDTVLLRRGSAHRISLGMLLAGGELDAAVNWFEAMRATPCLWILSRRYDATVLYGFYKGFKTVLNYPDYSDCSVDLEGLK